MNFTQLSALDDMAKAIFEANADKGFWEGPVQANVHHVDADFLAVPSMQYLLLKKMEKLGLIISEVAEGIEAIRKPGPSEHIPDFTAEEEELADAIIRIFDYSGGFHLRLAEAVHAKLAFNASRPHKHGKKF